MKGNKFKKRQIDSYNAFRGICAVGILFSHMSYLLKSDNSFWYFFYDHFMRYGSRCTTFFFIMSGFLLAYTWKDVSFRKYIQNKLKRLYPLTLFVFILAVGCSIFLNGTVNKGMAIGSPLWGLSIVLNVILLKAFVPLESVFYSFHGPSWYISVLFVFYIVGFFIVKRIKHSDKPHKVELNLMIVVTITYIIQLLLCMIVDLKELTSIKLYLTYVNPYFRIWGEGLLGILLCEKMPEIRERIKGWNKDTIEVGTLIIFISFFILNNFFYSSIWNGWIWFLPFSLVIIAFNSDMGVASRIAKGDLWQFLGNISFELYMTHAFVYEGIPIAVGLVSNLLKNWLINHAGTRFILTLFISVIFAWIVHILFNSKKGIWKIKK